VNAKQSKAGTEQQPGIGSESLIVSIVRHKHGHAVPIRSVLRWNLDRVGRRWRRSEPWEWGKRRQIFTV